MTGRDPQPETPGVSPARLSALSLQEFRCFESAGLEAVAGVNLITGRNASGKTSLLEAIYLLGRGRSFRVPRLSALVRHGAAEAVVFGQVGAGDERRRLGIRLGAAGTEVHVDGRSGQPIAQLAAAFPVQLIDPQVHDLVQGGPGERRRFLDWGVFHVKHEFLPAWQRYRRALQQRNAAIRAGAGPGQLAAWDQELAPAGETVDRLRREYVDGLSPKISEYAAKMLLNDVKIVYQAGYSEAGGLAEALRSAVDRDRAAGSTQLGPHRAELRIEAGGQPARHRLSRGQQKALAASLVLAQADHLRESTGRAPVLLIDEPAAELDGERLGALLDTIAALDGQVFITALTADSLPLTPARQFHVERGEVAVLL